MKKIFTLILIIILFTSLLAETKNNKAKKTTEPTGKLAGQVTDEKGNPVQYANVSVLSGKNKVTGKQTKENGSYLIIGITPGEYDVLCTRTGYKAKKITGVKINSALTTILNISIKQQDIETEGIEVIENKDEIVIPTNTGSGKTEDKDVRGGKSNETSYTVDGMSVSDPVKEDTLIEEDFDAEDESDIEVIETIGSTSLKPYRETSKTVSKKGVKPSPGKPYSSVTASSYSGLKAGFVDDNKQFNYFLNFLEIYKRQVNAFPINISERIVLNIKDGMGKSLPDAKLRIFSGNKELENGLSYSDGSYFFFPTEYKRNISKYRLEVEYDGIIEDLIIDRQGKREIDVTLANIQKAAMKNIPLDLLFILDT
ncbi:MAG: carboxypeptidase regulatory-like domain-containing protein, partial [Candidatus Cloacimonetes bacterium]|nr:carboxypeptidase regulatory-like domain-containing protein [Candidatus Cloacimonadota bacterium]